MRAAFLLVAALVCADETELNEMILLQLRARGDIMSLNTASSEVASSYNSTAVSKPAGSDASSAKCVDTPGWKNPKNKNCHKYKKKGWCKDGKVLQQWTVGAKWKFPEKNCCVCGKGAAADDSDVDDSDAADNAMCTDTPGWRNPTKKMCWHYKKRGWCKDGKVRKHGGSKWNFPEKNCCVCGKGAGADGGDPDEDDGDAEEDAKPDPPDCKKDWVAQKGKAMKSLIKAYGMHFKEMKKASTKSKRTFSCLKNKWCHHGSGSLVNTAGATTYTWGCVK